MPANTSPIYLLTPIVACVKIPYNNAISITNGAFTNGDATNTPVQLCQIGADGGWIDKINIIGVGAAATTVSASPILINIFISNVVAASTNATNTRLLAQHIINPAAITVDSAASGTTYDADVLLGIPIDANDYIHVAQSVATGSANAYWQVCAFGGNFS